MLSVITMVTPNADFANEIAKTGKNPKDVVINKATIIFPYDIEGDYDKLEKYPMILSSMPNIVLIISKAESVVSVGVLGDGSI